MIAQTRDDYSSSSRLWRRKINGQPAQWRTPFRLEALECMIRQPTSLSLLLLSNPTTSQHSIPLSRRMRRPPPCPTPTVSYYCYNCLPPQRRFRPRHHLSLADKFDSRTSLSDLPFRHHLAIDPSQATEQSTPPTRTRTTIPPLS